MGQHKTNPNAIAKKAGTIPPKPRNMTARERDERILEAFMKTEAGHALASISGVFKGNR